MARSHVVAAGVAAGVLSWTIGSGAQAETPETKRQAEAAVAQDVDGTPLDEISVTATRQATQVLDVPGTVSVIGRKQIDDRQIRDAQDIVRYEPGINVPRQTSGTDPFGNLGSFSIRGVGGNRVQIQVDGTRIQEQITDGNRGFFDLPAVKAVEIQRGPGSVLWGADALGGVVAFKTLDPADLLGASGKTIAGRAETSFDSFNDRFSKTGMVAFQATPDLQGLFVINQSTYHEGRLSKARADGGNWGCPRVADAIRCDKLNPLDGTSWSALAKFVWTPTDDHEIKLTGEIFDSNNRISQLYDYGLQTTGAFNGDYDRVQDQTRMRLSLSHHWTVGAPWLEEVRWQASYSPQRREVNSDRFQRLASGEERDTRTLLRYDETFLQADLQLTSLAETGPISHRFTYGFQGDYTRTDYLNQTAVTPRATGLTTVTRASGFANARTTRADIYVQDEIKAFDGRFTLTPGVRWANYAIDPKPEAWYQPIGGFEPKKLDSSRVIPQVGALLKLTDEYSVYARYAEGFKMPTAQQLYTSSPGVSFDLVPNPNLKPESVRSYEAGLRGQYGATQYFDSAWFSAGAFYADYTNFIQNFYNIGPRPIEPGEDPNTVRPDRYTYRNLSSVDIWGVEASAEVVLNPNWSVNGTLSWQRGNQRAEKGDPKTAFDGAIPLVGVLGVRWRDPDLGLQIEGVGTFAQGVKRASDASLFKPGGYAIFDLFATWSPKITGWGPVESITFRGAVQNVFDTRYFKGPLAYTFNVVPLQSVAITNPLELQTSPGRTFKVSASVSF
ncbi:TonB-dependent hemoglobin/transferrin/lactoferrin family receptor [Methylopila musalis]|uniref:TonB-dependent hemoglobin/transferrin/lactoferrin family receptor n=1 Tax=Methylopila musalis TaxID=1134781 RepID=A0ABW3Z974_9HYPH